MFSKTKLFTARILLAGVLLGGFGLVSAQENKDDKTNKDGKVTVSKKEEAALKKIEKGKSVDEKLKLVADFVKEFPQSPARQQVVNYAASQVLEQKENEQIVQNGNAFLTIFTQPEETDLILPNVIYSYVQLKRFKEAFDTAQTYISRHPEDVSSRVTLVIEGTNNLRAGNKDFLAPTQEYALKAIELIEADKRPANVAEAQWQEYKTKWLPQLYYSQGFIEFNAGNKEKARMSLEKSSTLNDKDTNTWILLASMLDEEYQTLALKVNATGAGAERDAMLNQANEKLDKTIEAFARIVALTDGKPEAKPINDQVRDNLKTYYEYRHKNTDGMQALIDKYKK